MAKSSISLRAPSRRELLIGGAVSGVAIGAASAKAPLNEASDGGCVSNLQPTRNPLIDPRIDPRIKSALGERLRATPGTDVLSREDLLAEQESEAAAERAEALKASRAQMNTEEVAPSAGLSQRVLTFKSDPDGNSVKISFIRPDNADRLACVYYIHGGGMMTGSCFDGNYQAWARIIAAQGVAVAMVDFRNSLRASSSPEVAPFPAGLNDCVSGLKWLCANAAQLNIDEDAVVIAGDSGGANLALATGLSLKREKKLDLIKGLYAMCPYIAGKYPDPKYPSTIENNGIFLHLYNNRGLMAYGIEAFQSQDVLAWPAFAKQEDVEGFPPTIISVNECDPLRDEGVEFYRLLLRSGVSARCRQVMGTTHAVEVFPAWCTDISQDTAADLAYFTKRTLS
ncbi:alpha/beta hydrolase [Hyphococcus sp. DH-69]|uniref:alpha/beta hydrolase n=1 Tax=Hyphococcus formosus TaxID=3143534 RepID=UPI00398B75D3